LQGRRATTKSTSAQHWPPRAYGAQGAKTCSGNSQTTVPQSQTSISQCFHFPDRVRADRRRTVNNNYYYIILVSHHSVIIILLGRRDARGCSLRLFSRVRHGQNAVWAELARFWSSYGKNTSNWIATIFLRVSCVAFFPLYRLEIEKISTFLRYLWF